MDEIGIRPLSSNEITKVGHEHHNAIQDTRELLGTLGTAEVPVLSFFFSNTVTSYRNPVRCVGIRPEAIITIYYYYAVMYKSQRNCSGGELQSSLVRAGVYSILYIT